MIPSLPVTPEGDLDINSEALPALTEEPKSYEAADQPPISEAKLPSGARVSPLRPFFRQRAKDVNVENANVKSLEDALCGLKLSASRPRSSSHGSDSSETPSSSSSIGTTSSSRSVATAISSIGDSELPQGIPRIKYSDWSQFGISLFTPKLANPHSQLHYHYLASATRPRSRSSVMQRPDLITKPDCISRPRLPSYASNRCMTTHSEVHMVSGGLKRSPLRRATLDRSFTNCQ